MHRSTRIGIFVLLLVGVAAGTALATRGPGTNQTLSLLAGSHKPEASEAAEAPPTADELAHAADRLKAHDVTVDAAQLEALATKYGLGGAVRLMAWSNSTHKSVADLSAMRDAGKGWGGIAHELGVSPAIGWIMGNGHDGTDNAKAAGAAKDHAAEADESPEGSESPEPHESPDESPGD
jgi:hypothetical protein